MVKVMRFTANWCSPCRALAPIIEDIKEQNPDVEFQVVDIDETPELVSEYSVMSVPTIIIQNNGVETNRFIGIQPKAMYENAINNQKGN